MRYSQRLIPMIIISRSRIKKSNFRKYLYHLHKTASIIFLTDNQNFLSFRFSEWLISRWNAIPSDKARRAFEISIDSCGLNFKLPFSPAFANNSLIVLTTLLMQA
jgi:hypothetical protein